MDCFPLGIWRCQVGLDNLVASGFPLEFVAKSQPQYPKLRQFLSRLGNASKPKPLKLEQPGFLVSFCLVLQDSDVLQVNKGVTFCRVTILFWSPGNGK
jgi:hypothetical protein